MNALQDPTKKTSINSLLNPQESSAFPAHPVDGGHGQNHSHQPSSFHSLPYSVSPINSFHLRAASWDQDDDPHKRRPLNGAHNVQRHYQQHPTLSPVSSSQIYVDPHASRFIMRPRIDESPMYTNEGHVWQHKHPQPPPPLQQQQQQQQQHHVVPGMSYASYSDERTGAIINPTTTFHILTPEF